MMTWTHANLASLADYCENKATIQRESAAALKPTARRAFELRAAAAENESLAYMLRHTTITGGEA
jgi:hypothetical protein